MIKNKIYKKTARQQRRGESEPTMDSDCEFDLSIGHFDTNATKSTIISLIWS